MEEGLAFWEASEGATFRHEGKEIPVEHGFVLINFCKWHATIADHALVFWASSDHADVPIEGAVKDVSTDTTLDSGCFDQCFSENWRCGNIYPASLFLCDYLAEHRLCGPGKRALSSVLGVA
jgi:hypothetical protein